MCCIGRQHLPEVCGTNMPFDCVTGGRHLVAARPGALEHCPGRALRMRENHDKHNTKIYGSYSCKVLFVVPSSERFYAKN